MSVLNDIKSLKEYYNSRWQWYLAAINKTESDIQTLWNEYFVSGDKFKVNVLKLHEIDKYFQILRGALDYFRTNALTIEKRLDELDKQEYAIINTNDEPIN